jgi:outer membrane protein assembly factor BamB
LYVALRRRDTVRAEAHVACFDAFQGRLLWRRFLCAAETLGAQRPYELTHNLLTLDQGRLFYNSNMGVVAALRASGGDIEWLSTYPRVSLQDDDPDRNDQYRFRDLTPCLVCGDFVFVAPMDCDRIFALDATTGHPLWMTERERAADAIHLLGVGADTLLVSGNYLYWLDRYTGRLVGQYPLPRKAAPGHARPNPRGFGRGLLAGSHVYWPTREAIFVFERQMVRSQRGREPVLVREIPLVPRGATGGNLVIADGVLLVATADRLYAFNETGKPDHARGRRRTSRTEVE